MESLTSPRLLEVLASDAAILAAVDEHDLDRTVPACPGWTVADVLVHLGKVHSRAVELLAGIDFVPLDRWPEPPATGRDGVAWARQETARLVEAAHATDPDAPTTTWMGARPARFWIRRMTQETAVHRWDVQAALGSADGLPSDLGQDGVDELFEVFCPRLGPDTWATVAAGPELTVHLHCTDGPGEWLVRVTPTDLRVSPEHAKGDAAVRGTGGDLNLLLWGRLPPTADGLEVLGDRNGLDRLLRALRF